MQILSGTCSKGGGGKQERGREPKLRALSDCSSLLINAWEPEWMSALEKCTQSREREKNSNLGAAQHSLSGYVVPRCCIHTLAESLTFIGQLI